MGFCRLDGAHRGTILQRIEGYAASRKLAQDADTVNDCLASVDGLVDRIARFQLAGYQATAVRLGDLSLTARTDEE